MIGPDHQKALQALHEAVKLSATFAPAKLGQQQRDAIEAIINGDHLTFRYLLITALLAKTVEPRIHMRSLQAGAKLKGAYDARSLCHHVWVPFEREHLDDRLGGSNEPFLNKPARFPAIEKTNAVRAGRDRDLLHMLHDLLESLNKGDARVQKEAFLYAMSLVSKRDGRTRSALPIAPVVVTAPVLSSFLESYLSQSFGGEVPVSVIGSVLAIRHRGPKSLVRVHPANQAGTSSNEVGDIDVYLGDVVAMPIEVKDKSFAKADIEHAVTKARTAGCPRLLFVVGRKATASNDIDVEQLIHTHAKSGFDLALVSVDTIVQSEVPLMNEPDRRGLLQLIYENLIAMRSKDETKRHFEASLSSAGLIDQKAATHPSSA